VLREAIQVRPEVAASHHNLGEALRKKGRLDEAEGEFREAIRIEPDNTNTHVQLGQVLCLKGKLDEAFAECRAALRIKPVCPGAHFVLGSILRTQGRLDEAISEYQEAVRLDPSEDNARYNIAFILAGKGQLDEAIAVLREAVRVRPEEATSHNNLGMVLSDKGRLDEAIAAYREAIRLKKDDVLAHSNLGVALYDKGQLDEAIAEFREAIRLKKDFAGAHRNLGIALRVKGALDKLPAILKGEARPADAAECLTLADLCQRPYQRRYAASARFFGDGFTAEPKLADDLNTQHRYNAACAAALAGCGRGDDAAKLDDKERARLRRQALDWLRADLKAYRQVMEKSAGKAGPAVAERMQHWLQDTDFAGVRGAEALGKLPEAERQDWQKLWADVAATLVRAREGGAPKENPASPRQAPKNR
jgi:tetratricopeptide (TPR) repeat protein